MSLRNSMFQSLFWRACSFITAFILNLLIARSFGPALSGELNFFIAVAAFILLFTGFNLDASIIYFSAGNRIALNKLFSLMTVYILSISLLYFFLSLLISGNNALPFTGSHLTFYIWLYAAGMQVSSFSFGFFYGRQNFTLPGVLISSSNVLQIIVLIILLFSDRQNFIDSYLPFFLVIPFVQGLIGLIYARMKYIRAFRFSLPSAGELTTIFRFSAAIFFTNLLLFLMYRIDYWMLKELDFSTDKMERLGNYIQVSKIGQTFLLFSSAIGSAVFSRISAGSSGANNSVEHLCRIIRVLVGSALIFYLLFFIAGKYLIYLLFGAAFPHIYPCFLLLMPGIIALMTVSITANFLAGSGLTRFNLFGVMTGLVIIVVGNYFFIPHFSIYAASLISTVGYVVYAIYMLVNFRKITGCDWKELLFPSAKDLLYISRLFATLPIKNNLR